jgi:FAD/FMN-containing dehydrogenase
VGRIERRGRQRVLPPPALGGPPVPGPDAGTSSRLAAATGGRGVLGELSIRRREFLAYACRFATAAVAGGPLLALTRVRTARARTPIAELRRTIAAAEGAVLTPDDSGFALARRDFNLRIDVIPKAIVQCRSSRAVERAVEWAATYDVPVHVRAGGHSYEGTSLGEGLVIDVGPLDGIAIDERTRTARIGAGARLGACYAASTARGLAPVAGRCGSVGMAGLTLGGGHGFLVRAFGLACDQLRAVRLVDARGRQITASAKENAELFWALRGAGGSGFGVVTELEVALHPVTRVVTWWLAWPPRDAAQVLGAWQELVPRLPDGAGILLQLDAVAGRGVVSTSCQGVYIPLRAKEKPTADTVRAMLRPLVAAVSPVAQTVHAERFQATVPIGRKAPEPVLFKGKSDILTMPLGPAAIDAVIDALQHVETGPVAMMLDGYGGAIARVGNDATAFAHRDALACVQWYTQWRSPHETDARLAMMRALYARVHPHFSGGANVNYCDADLTDGPRAYFGAHLERLREVKKAVDPANRFRSGVIGITPAT